MNLLDITQENHKAETWGPLIKHIITASCYNLDSFIKMQDTSKPLICPQRG